MKLHTLTLLFFAALVCGIFCDLGNNPFDPRKPGYTKPSMTFDNLPISGNAIVSIDSLMFVVRGNHVENIFRWRTENPGLWSPWRCRRDGTDTFRLTHLQPGMHVVRIQTAYHWNGDIADTTLTFHKVDRPAIIAMSEAFVQRLFAQSCTLWIKSAGTAPLSYQWRKDAGAVDRETSDTLIFPKLANSDAGRYRCIVSNAWGNDTSEAIVLSVIPKYRLTYDGNTADSGAVPVDSNYYKEKERATVKGNEGHLIKTGHAFTGWNTSASGDGKDYSPGSTATMGPADDTLYAKWKINQYTVAFNTQGGSAIAEQKVDHGSHASEPDAPTRKSYVFAGWFKEAACVNTWIFTEEIVTTPITLYAKWLVRDGDGNTYSTVTIGTQVWMAENLKTTVYNDGSAIPQVADSAAWANCAAPGYCWYDNNEAVYKNVYGALYNWHAVNTGKLAPAGWHVPTDTE